MTSTAKNFAGQNLSGRSFKGQDLSGSDFSGTDLRGANFTNATLIGANFSKSDTGVQKRWFAFQLIISFFLSIFSGYLAAYIGVWTTLFFARYYIENSRIEGIAMIIIVILIFLAIIRQGFTSATFGIITGTFVLALLGTGSIEIVLAGAVLALVTVVLSWTFALLGTRSLVVWSGIFLGALSGTFSAAVGAAWGGSAVSFEISLAGAVILAVGTASLSGYAAWRTLKGDRKFDKMLKFSVAFASICGTSFRGADLKNANFTDAYLKSSDFRNSRGKNTNLTRTLWRQAEKLNRSRLGTSILANPEVRELLVTGKPNQSKSYEGLNLRGANLDGVYLENVNFKRAILNEASFRNANLKSGNFTEAQAIGTDFTGAQMTGVCVEGWSYDHTTKLDSVIF